MEITEKRKNEIEEASLEVLEGSKYKEEFIAGATWSENNPLDSILDLSSVWHSDKDELPSEEKLLIGYRNEHGDIAHKIYSPSDENKEEIIHWAKISDLLPKITNTRATRKFEILSSSYQREQKIEEVAREKYPKSRGKRTGFILGALWADNNPREGVVNLTGIWRSPDEKPRKPRWNILCWDGYDDIWKLTSKRFKQRCDDLEIDEQSGWEDYIQMVRIYGWTYIFDLTPKP